MSQNCYNIKVHILSISLVVRRRICLSDLNWNNGDDKKKDSESKLPSGREPNRVVRKEKKEKQMKDKSLYSTKVRRNDQDSPDSGLVSRLLVYLYKNLYIIGALVIRRWRRFRKLAHLFISRIRGGIHSSLFWVKNFVSRGIKEFIRHTKQPFIRFKEEWRRARSDLDKAKSKKKKDKTVSLKNDRIRLVTLAAGVVWRVLRTILNYALPVVAAVMLVMVVQSFSDISLGIHVIYKDQDIGYIRNENEFADALEDVESRIVTGLESNYTSGVPRFEVVVIEDQDQYTPLNILANNIIKASSDEIQPAYAVYVNNELLGAVEDGDSAYNALQETLDRNRTGKLKERVEFQKNVSYTDGIFPKSSIISEDEMLEKIYSDEIKEEVYIVEEGDTLSTIADRTGTSIRNIERLNPSITEDTDLKPGTELYMAKARPLLSVQNIYTDIYTEEIPYKVEETPDAMYAEGYREVISEGVPGTGRVTAEITAIDGVEITRNILSVEQLSEPIAERVKVGTNEGVDASTGFMWPGRGGYISCYVGGYPGHAGIDIAGTGGVGSPVYASSSGTVVKASWGYVGYGNHIIIDHGDGWQTLYAHNSDMYVSVGDYVQKGKIIAAVGATGWATGPHIHFEVIHNGQKLNPVHYVGSR